MKKKVFYLLICNFLMLLFIGIAISKFRGNKPRQDSFMALNSVDKIVIRNRTSNYKFFLEKSPKSRKWSINWNDESWIVNGEELTAVYGRLVECFNKERKNFSDSCYEITVFSKNLSKTVKLNLEDSNFVFLNKPGCSAKLQFSDDTIVTNLLSEKIFSYVRSGCKIFKVKLQNDEYIFANRHGKWFLENFGENLQLSNEQITKIFHKLFSLAATEIAPLYDCVIPPSFSISLYGDNISERITFFDIDDNRCLVLNDAVDLLFTIEHSELEKTLSLLKNLLKMQVFLIGDSEDVDVILPASDEHFNLHDARQGEWQFTYSKEGEFQVKDISVDQANALLQLLKNMKSIKILSDIPSEDKSFSITFDKQSNQPKIFNFYQVDDRLYVEEQNKQVKFEIENFYCPEIFHILRSFLLEKEAVL